jgi:hypothetical protein
MQIPDMEKKEELRLFIRGLKWEVQCYLELQQLPDDLHYWQQAAQKYDDIKASQFSRSNKWTSSDKSKNVHQFEKKDMSKIKCYNCQKLGHTSKTCTAKL